MAMYGWLASTEDIDRTIEDPSTLEQLKKFNSDASTEPFKFSVSDVVDTTNTEGSLDHTVWISISNSNNEKVGEISTDISDNETGPLTSNNMLLAACLDNLGFVDKEEGLGAFVEEQSSQVPDFDGEPELEEPAMVKSARTLAAKFKRAVSTGIELAEGYTRSPEVSGFGADDTRANFRDQRSKVIALVNSTKEELREAYQAHQAISKYVSRNNGWTNIFKSPLKSEIMPDLTKLRTEFTEILKENYENLGSEMDKETFRSAFHGFNLKAILQSDMLNQRTILASKKLSQHIATLDRFIETGNKLPVDRSF